MSESDLLKRAFMALGGGPTWRELELVGNAVRESGDQEAIEALTLENMEALVELARASGSNAFVALDLVTEVGNPGEHAALFIAGRDSRRAPR